MDYYIGMQEKQEVFTIMGGRIKIMRGIYNPTSDAVWLAAFIDGSPKTVLDVGCGTGAVALCMAARMPNLKITALDISADMLTAAKTNFALNGLGAEFINADILSWRTARTFDAVVTNPPYFHGTPAKHNAHHNANLSVWTKKCIARVRPNGIFATIVDAAETATVLSEMACHCGNIKILPLFSRKDTAERVILSGQVGRAAKTTIMQAMNMNDDAVLREGKSVADVRS